MILCQYRTNTILFIFWKSLRESSKRDDLYSNPHHLIPFSHLVMSREFPMNDTISNEAVPSDRRDNKWTNGNKAINGEAGLETAASRRRAVGRSLNLRSSIAGIQPCPKPTRHGDFVLTPKAKQVQMTTTLKACQHGQKFHKDLDPFFAKLDTKTSILGLISPRQMLASP